MLRRPSSRIVMLISTIGLLVSLLSCSLGALAIQQGQIAPPEIYLDLGRMRLISLTSNLPDCTRLLAPGCGRQNGISKLRVYTMWLLVQRERDSWERPELRSLLSIKISQQ
jgi:hypothetical protein